MKSSDQKIIIYLLFSFAFLLFSCDSKSQIKAGKNNKMMYGTKQYVLSKGIEEVFKLDDNHSSSRINITDGDFYHTQVTISGNLHWIWRAKNASVWLYVNMYSPGNGGLKDGLYVYKPRNTNENDPTLADTYFFKKGKIAIDLNNDGELESDNNEFIKIIGGTIKMKVLGDNYFLEFDLELDNDINVTGSFEGYFNQV